ncbi:MAG TPA: hypothetical protein VFQ65_00465, partial [Kofleriaceae bacterium]|nr:hypothetical protein [Kofleriaceae bacterium]
KLATVALLVAAACGGVPSTPPPSPPRPTEDAPALEALRAASFPQAIELSHAQLAIAPRDAEAAAIHALASYVQAAQNAYTELDVRHSFLYFDKAFTPEGQPAVVALANQLEAIDRDLEVVAADPRFAVELCFACWSYDWNHDGAIDRRDQQLLQIEVDPAGAQLDEHDPRRTPTFRFDVGDALWARAMVSFQRAGLELLLAYRWSDANRGANKTKQPVVIHLISADRVAHARELVLAGLDFSDASRHAYLAETDDDREWVPNPHQHSHPIPLEVDDRLYETWSGVVGDVRELMAGKRGLGLRELATLISPELTKLAPDAYIDVGRMFTEPTDITLPVDDRGEDVVVMTRWLRGVLGHGYAEHMVVSPLVARLAAMRHDLESGGETLEHKLRYLLWIN